jgi:alkanesulfonate monooxygenase SsuD/methylene tetrahydromethanopterin reductase-like flavin-dependent oxidoreductase (luciferase family)
MRHGAVIPWATEREFAELAAVAEEAGWDQVFSWEAVWGQDAWVTLGAAAMTTERIRLGTLLTPAARHRPWDLASKVASVDRLSGGRVTLGVGLGALHGNWLAFEADEGRAVRARKLDEGLAIYAGLMGGQPFEFTGEHYSAAPVTELVPPPPVQQPHPPVWCVGLLVPGRTRQRSLERAARWQGVFPAVAGGSLEDPGSRLTHDRLREVVERIGTLRADAGLSMEGYDVVVEGDSHGSFGETRPPVQAWADAGATWWVESWWDLPDDASGRAELRRRLALGPQR